MLVGAFAARHQVCRYLGSANFGLKLLFYQWDTGPAQNQLFETHPASPPAHTSRLPPLLAGISNIRRSQYRCMGNTSFNFYTAAQPRRIHSNC